MSLIVELWLTTPQGSSNDWLDAGMLRVSRIGELRHPEGSLECADEVHEYQVELDGRDVGRVQHRYGNNVWALAQQAVALVVFREENL